MADGDAMARPRRQKAAASSAKYRRHGNNTTNFASASNLTAVCLCGSMRTFLQPAVQLSFVNHVHHAGYEYFMVTDRPMPASHTILVSPIRAWYSDGNMEPLMDGRPNTEEKDKLPRGRCPRGTCNPLRFLYPFAQRLPARYYLLQAEEALILVLVVELQLQRQLVALPPTPATFSQNSPQIPQTSIKTSRVSNSLRMTLVSRVSSTKNCKSSIFSYTVAP